MVHGEHVGLPNALIQLQANHMRARGEARANPQIGCQLQPKLGSGDTDYIRRGLPRALERLDHGSSAATRSDRSRASRSRLAELLAPCQKSVKGRAKRLSPASELILDLWRDLGMHDPPDHAIALQLSELLREHLLGNGRYRSLEV